ncbi:EboA domain-containing protein [Paraglaciecola aquimarina]|uniref:EboA domain-containing protein n=1 Tax=Paraglaciecola aquimarina TaxID=1235557 RepID=A0ABU3SZ28_9ALTE|nr:EboA domain-containing protein [Paraglaciecola aquimarina]MDU0355274.1 EboA domain-containing protein [Paraglaciecola aquimarina]
MHLNKLTDLIYPYLSADELEWLQSAMSALQTSADPMNDLLDISVLVKRKVSSTLAIQNDLVHVIDGSELIRILLIHKALSSHAELSTTTLVKGYYQAGDSSEKAALLRGLNVIDPKGEAASVAIRAARCNSLDEFTALALNNGYASMHFEDLNFNQLVLKTLFLGLDIDNLVGLRNRLSPSLSNMCFSYVVEQALADRVPPATIWLAIRYQDLTLEHSSLFNQYTEHFISKSDKHQTEIKKLIKNQSI